MINETEAVTLADLRELDKQVAVLSGFRLLFGGRWIWDGRFNLRPLPEWAEDLIGVFELLSDAMLEGASVQITMREGYASVIIWYGPVPRQDYEGEGENEAEAGTRAWIEWMEGKKG